jgi:hypothetical protein
MVTIWLTEPLAIDDTWARRGEQPLEWLARSTLPRAKAIRRFLNENISELPEDSQSDLVYGLRHRFKSAFFELVVARSLQFLGATITVEARQEDGRRPDFRARFPDATIVIEAASPNFNSDVGEEIKNRNPLIEMIEGLAPQGWSIQVWQVPAIGQAESKQGFKRAITRMLSIPPPASDNDELELIEELPVGTIHLRLVARRPNWPPIALEAPYSIVDDSKEALRKVIRRKRRQVRNADVPVLLAVEGTWLSGSLENFDLVLYGYPCEVLNERRERESPRFIPDGLFSNGSDKPPTYAGVLAFGEVGFSSMSDPVLYHHPRFKGNMPEALSVLEQHWYEQGAGVDSVKISPATLTGQFEAFGFVKV